MIGPEPAHGGASGFVLFVTVMLAVFMLGAGVWGLLAPASFADFAGFAASEHFVHDAGAFQVGIGATLLLALLWGDGLAAALAGFLLSNILHTINHAVDLDIGGHERDVWLLALLSLLAAAALVARLRHSRGAISRGREGGA